MKHTGFRYSMFLITFIILVVSVALYTYLYMQTGSMVDEALKDRAAIKSAQATRLQGTEIVQLLHSTADRRTVLNAFFVPAQNAVAVIQAIESVGDLSGAAVVISSISATAPTDATKVGHVSASVAIEGTWKQVMHAIVLFQTLPYDRRMNSLTLRSVGDKDAHWRATFALSVGTLASPVAASSAASSAISQ